MVKYQQPKIQGRLVLIQAAKAQLLCLFFNNRDYATARRKECFAHFFVVLRRAFGAAK
jgi:hypothetical protein